MMTTDAHREAARATLTARYPDLVTDENVEALAAELARRT
jgi:hypothetical protein